MSGWRNDIHEGLPTGPDPVTDSKRPLLHTHTLLANSMGNNPSVQVPSSPDRNPDRQPSYSESAAQVPLKPLNYLKEERPDYRKWADGKPDFFTHTFAVNITVPRDAKYIDVPKGKGGVGLVLVRATSFILA